MTRPALVLTPDERIAYPYLFAKADTDQIGVLIGEKAVAFFAHSKLPPTILGEIWQLADNENAGFLTRQQFDIALRLIGKAQRGLPVSEAAISTPGPLCRLEGIQIPGIAVPTSPFPAPGLASSVPPSSNNPLNQISAEDKAKYTRMFINAGPNDGLLDGDKAKDIFIRSKLSFDTLGQIWTLSDTQSRGALSVGDFCIAMHLIQLTMSGRLSTLPSTLPQPLLDSAAGHALGANLPISRQMTGQSSLPPVAPRRQPTISTPVRPQYTGQSASMVNTLAQSGGSGSIGVTSPTRLPWDISFAELAQSNVFFDTLDTTKQGYITGDRAVPFMMESKLPGEILARIWDLADIRGEGKLSREEFAVAMRLIQDTLAGGSESLLPNLPPGMVPPSLRDSNKSLPPIQEASDTQRDLLSLMDDDVPPAKTVGSPVPSNIQPQHTRASLQPTTVAPQLTGTKSLNPSARIASPSPLAQPSLTAQLTGRSLTSNHLTPFSAGLEDSGARLGNLHTQVSSTENALSQTLSEKSRLEGEVGSTQEQIRNLEVKLSAAREALQSETPVVEDLKAKLAEQRSTLNKLNAESIAAESELSALRVERDQIQENIMRDKEEVRGIKKRMSELEEETQRLRATLESLKKDSRLQKGLVAISKKQAATVEGQKDEISKEITELQVPSPNDSIRSPEKEFQAPEISASLSQKSTNPFERMMSAPPVNSSGDRHAESLPISSSRSPLSQDGFGDGDDPFSMSPKVPEPHPGQAANTLSFGDAFSFDDTPQDEGQKNPKEQTGFEDSFSAAAFGPKTEEATFSLTPPMKDDSMDHVIAEPSQNSKPTTAPNSDDDDSSSDEDEIEDATPSFLPPSSRTKSPNVPESNFPPLEDVGPMLDSKLKTPKDPKPEESTSNSPENQTQSSRAQEKNPQSFSNFGDELEISDFAADFGKLGTGKSTGATLEDFDSAFESLPMPSSDKKPKSTNNQEDSNGFGSSFDDAFGDSFSVTKKVDDLPGFEESMQGLSNNQPKVLPEKGKVEKEDEGPPLPSRPSKSHVSGGLDQVKAEDSDAVKQICAMGFDRKVAIEALDKYDGNVERALNHLLGS